MPDINGIPYVESSDLVSAYPAASQALAQEVSDQLASKLPYEYGTATPSTSVDGFLWYDENDTPPTPKFWDGAAFQALTSGKILQVVRATDSTRRTTTSSGYADAGISVSITPTKSTSAVILIWSARSQTLTSNGTQGNYQITDSSNNAISGAEDSSFYLTASTGYEQRNLFAYATPATTSSVTYKVRYQRSFGSGSVVLANDQNTGQMYAIEVGA